MRRRLLAAAIVGSIVGSLTMLFWGPPAAHPGPMTAVGSPALSSASPSGSALGVVTSPSGAASPAPPASRPTVPSVNPRPTRQVVATLEARLDELRVEHGIPGISVSIVFPDGSYWNGVSGLADVAAKRPVTTDTAFSVASISKTFLAALFLDLAAEGRLGLEDAAGKYLPEQKNLEGITIRMLLGHTSGLRDYFLHARIDRALRADPSSRWTTGRALGYVGKPYFEPGKGWHYSNTNYLLLGMIAERVDGRPLAAQFRARYFEPLGLDDTFYQVAERPAGPTARGYRFNGSGKRRPAISLADGTGVMPFRSLISAAGGAGSLASSSLDIARWARALYGGHAIDQASLALMVGGVGDSSVYKPSIPYGLGVQAIDVNGRFTLGHSGRFLGFRSVVRYLPAEGVAIAVLTNQSRANPEVIARRLLLIAVPPRHTGPCLCLDAS